MKSILVIATFGILVSFFPLSSAQTPELGSSEEVANAAPRIQDDPVRRFLTQLIGVDKETRISIADTYLENVESRLQSDPSDLTALKIKIAALGVLGRSKSTLSGMRGRYASTSREALDKALAAADEDQWISVLEGLWHLEVARRAGMLSGAAGASTRKGNQILEGAASSLPGDPSVTFAHAVALVAYGDRYSISEAEPLIAETLSRINQLQDSDQMDQTSQLILEATNEINAMLEQKQFRDAEAFAKDIM